MSYLILACSGLDKPEGSVTREVALRLAEEVGATIVCPVSLNRSPARYREALSDGRVVVVDGCATQCAAKLAGAAGARVADKVIVSEVLKSLGAVLEEDLRLGPDALALARKIADEIDARERSRAQATVRRGEAAASPSRTAASPSGAVAYEAPSDSVVVVHDKYEFRVPLTGFFFNANDVWIQVSGGRGRVGISDYMQQRLTDITYVDPPEPGTVVEQFDEVASVESTKATFELISPVSGTVVAVNEALADEPERINEDPYGSWIVELELASWEDDRALLADGPAYAAEVERKAAEY